MTDVALGAITFIVLAITGLAITAVALSLKNGSLRSRLMEVEGERNDYRDAYEAAKRLGDEVARGSMAARVVDHEHLDRLLAEVRSRRRAASSPIGDPALGAATPDAGRPEVPDPSLGEAHRRRIS